MTYPHGIRQEAWPTFLHPDGMPVLGEPYVTRTGLVLPSVVTSRAEFDALVNYAAEHSSTLERPLPTIKQLGRISIHEETGCWELPVYGEGNDVYPASSPQAGKKRARYGQLAIRNIGRRESLAHRTMYVIMRGLIPPGAYLDHLCENKGCCWHRHLEAVTPGDNSRRTHHADRLANGQTLLF